MSWLRKDWPLKRFKGKAIDNVNWNGLEVVYGKLFEDPESICETLYYMVLDSTEDLAFAETFMVFLAKKLGVEDKIRKTPLDCKSCKGCPEKIVCPMTTRRT